MLRQIVEIVRQAGKLMLEHRDIQTIKKAGVGDFSTDCDRRVQDFLQRHLSQLCPAARFAAEEDDTSVAGDASGEWFIIDPIDGTSNFICGQKLSAICVARLLDGELCMGVVYNPYTDEMFSAEKGRGAWLNAEPIHVKGREFSLGIVEFGSSPYDEKLRKAAFRLAEALSYHALDVHRLGAAALAICYVADNRNLLYFDFQLSPWDFAAAALVLHEAGGVCETMEGQALCWDRSQSILACAPRAAETFRQLWRESAQGL